MEVDSDMDCLPDAKAILPVRNIAAEIPDINKSNALLCLLILNEGSSLDIFTVRPYEPADFEVHDISYKREYTIAGFMITSYFLLKETNPFP
jgi:hypothetical protein